MKDKYGKSVKNGDVVKAIWRDPINGISINGFYGEVQQNMTVKHITPYETIFHQLRPISSEFEFEIIS
jgi:hypothetical protein